MNSATVKPALRIRLRSVPFLSERWLGTERLYRTPALVKMIWEPFSRMVHRARAKACAARCPETCGSFLDMRGRRWHFHLDFGDYHARPRVQLVTQLCKVGRNSVTDVSERFFVAIPFRDAAGQGRNFDSIPTFLCLAQSDQIFNTFASLTRHNSIIARSSQRAKPTTIYTEEEI